MRIARGQSAEHHGRGEPYLPLFGALGRFGRGPDRAAMIAVLRRFALRWLAQLPGLVSESELARIQRQVHGATPARMWANLAG